MVVFLLCPIYFVICICIFIDPNVFCNLYFVFLLGPMYFVICSLYFYWAHVFCNLYFVFLLGPCVLHFAFSDPPSWKFEPLGALLIWGKGWCWEGDADHVRQLLMFRCWRWCWSSPPPPHPGPPGDLVYLLPIYIFFAKPHQKSDLCLLFISYYHVPDILQLLFGWNQGHDFSRKICFLFFFFTGLSTLN